MVLILAGLVCFFAYNWEAMGRFTKLGLAAGGVVLSAGGAYWMGLDRLGGKVLLLTASVLVGVLIAVYGQVYQTGADAYELFLFWAALIFLWVWISDFAALWVLWMVILDYAASFFWNQVAQPEGWSFQFYFFSLALLHAFFLALREVMLAWGRKWLAGEWLRLLLLLTFLSFLTSPMMDWIYKDVEGLAFFLTPILWILGIALSFWVYRFRLPDPRALTLVFLDTCLVLTTYLIREIDALRGLDPGTRFLLSGLVVLLVVGTAAWGLKHWIGRMHQRRGKRTGMEAEA